MVALRPRDQHVWDLRPVPHETETETETNYCETETETETETEIKKVVLDLNIPAFLVLLQLCRALYGYRTFPVVIR